MAGFIDDLIKGEVQEEEKANVVEQVPQDIPEAPVGDGGDARRNLYGDAFLKKFGGR